MIFTHVKGFHSFSLDSSIKNSIAMERGLFRYTRAQKTWHNVRPDLKLIVTRERPSQSSDPISTLSRRQLKSEIWRRWLVSVFLLSNAKCMLDMCLNVITLYILPPHYNFWLFLFRICKVFWQPMRLLHMMEQAELTKILLYKY